MIEPSSEQGLTIAAVWKGCCCLALASRRIRQALCHLLHLQPPAAALPYCKLNKLPRPWAQMHTQYTPVVDYHHCLADTCRLIKLLKPWKEEAASAEEGSSQHRLDNGAPFLCSWQADQADQAVEGGVV